MISGSGIIREWGFINRSIASSGSVIQDDLIEQTIINEGGINEFNFNDQLDFKSWKEALASLSQVDSRSKILVDPTLEIDPRLFVSRDIYSWELQDRALSNFSYNWAKFYDWKLHQLYNNGITTIYKDANYKSRLKSLHDQTISNLKNLDRFENLGITHIVSSAKILDEKMLGEYGDYKVYEVKSDIGES